METEAVFIVGVSRSGTSLMRTILNRSDQIAIADENHFLGHMIPLEGTRYKFRKFGDLSDDTNVRRLVDYLYAGGLASSSRYRGNRGMSAHWRWIVKRVDREDFLQRILVSDRSERTLFAIMMQVFAEKKGKPIMGEKTPIHIRYVPTILGWFPNGKVIHMLRDPRAIFVSELRRRKKSGTTLYKRLKRVGFLYKLYIMLQTTILWLEGLYRCFKYKKLYPNNYYVLEFEDLVKDPEKHIKQVCDFLGVDFQDEMLDQEVVSEGFQVGKTGFDARAADRWKDRIEPWINAWFLFWFRKYLRELGYVD
jgi:hypothetical protein